MPVTAAPSSSSPAPAVAAPVVVGLLIVGSLVLLACPASPSIGLVAGMTLALVLGNPVADRTTAMSKVLLKASVVGLGCGMNLALVWHVASHNVSYTAGGIVLTLALGLALGRWAGLRRDSSLLVAAGTAICGGSAIAAVASVIRPKSCDLAISLTAIFLLNAVALFLFPPLGHLLGFSAHQFGLWAALAIHDTSSVVGAALRFSPDAMEVATTVKLTRALWIVPMVMALSWWWPRGDGSKLPWYRLPLPLFILGFVAAAALFTSVAPLAPWRAPITALAQRLFTVTLFLVGAGFSREALRTVGFRPLAVALVLWAVVAGSSAFMIAAGWLA